MSGKIRLKQILIDNLNDLLGAFSPSTDYSTIYYRQGSWYVGINPKKSTLQEVLMSGNTSTRNLVLSGYTLGINNGNLIFGFDSFKNITTATNNIAFGLRTLENALDCSNVIAIGHNSASNNINGSDNIYLGNNNNTNNNGSNNIVIGNNSVLGTNNNNNVILCNSFSETNINNRFIIGLLNNYLIDGDFINNKININGDVIIKEKITVSEETLYLGENAELIVRDKITGEYKQIEKPIVNSMLTCDSNGVISWVAL